jgi:hypothetical protein
VAVPFTRPAVSLALALAVGLVALPACKKTKPTVADSPSPTPAPTPAPAPTPVTPGPGTSTGGDPAAPKGPIFRGSVPPLRAGVRLAAEENMKHIIIALHNYHDTYGKLPGGYADKTGKPGLSWRVAILPFLEQDNLFKSFKLDEPWDSEANAKLIQYMPKTFAPPGQSTRGYTFTRGFSGPGTWLPPRTGTPGQMLAGVALTEIRDGTVNTILVADASEAVIWTKPEEIAFTPGTAPKVGGVFESGTVVGMADGVVKFLPKGIGPKTLADAIQIDDGRPVNLDK